MKKILSKQIYQILFVTFLILFNYATVCAQGEYYGDSSPASIYIANENLALGKMPVQYFVKKYVEENIAIWQQKGEFEKTTDYQKRVNESSRINMVQKFNDEALSKMKEQFTTTIKWEEFIVSVYDADNETYLVQSTELGQFALPVPISEAPDFKKNWKLMKIENVDFYIKDNFLQLAKFDAISQDGKIYNYDNNQLTTYAANNIIYNFSPIAIGTINDDTFQNNTKIEKKNTTLGLSDVDLNIPVNTEINNNTFAVIIANENYLREVKVQFAANDGKTFKEYCQKTLGIPQNNIHFSQDATFGTIKSEIKWLSDVIKAYNGEAKIIFYYAGHGMPDESDRSAYLLPIDGFSSDFETAINLNDLYNRLSQTPSQNVTIILDACFSGSIRDDGMLANARSVKIKPKENIVSGNMIVFSAATGDETAYPYTDKQHGLFTYYLLKKLQETKGDVNFSDLSNYVISNVKQQSVVINQKSQTPRINVSASLEVNWQQLKLK
jgi:hypothetical protein